ncbi:MULTISPECIES: class I SAM-dependent methyltransferase [Clostridium]|uniref:class I SAM-dependent methyltransferase n=1 Tax=Clostridium TaxID=1485 RepID=UPI0009FC2366|nr:MULTISPECIES: class I SAM-dependent methyltransferase [Clostridium]MCD2349041.1 methyltransferase domain-containing protein [Clostridium guangxiense]
MEDIEDYYKGYDEWNRLERHKIEFEITKRYLNTYVTEGARVFDIGGGPGRYSIYLAKRGHKVVLLDLVQKHIDIAKIKASENNVKIEKYICDDALNISEYNLGKFDVVLIMGPLYHLIHEVDRKKVVEDALKFLKKEGILIASFISAYAPIIDEFKCSENIETADEVMKYLKDGINDAEAGFTSAYFIKPEEAKNFMESFNLKELSFAGIEGIGGLIENKLKELPSEQFDRVINILYELSNDPHIFGSSEHYLYVGKKVDNNANGEIFNVGEEASKKIDYEKDDDILKEL